MNKRTKNQVKYRKIGILGGMGPEATAELYLRIIRIFQKEFGAVYDSEFPEMVILNLPIPDVVEDPKNEALVKKMLIKRANKLESSGADFIALPCNTVTCYLPKIREKVSISVLSIPEETAEIVKKMNLDKVGLLGTKMTIRENIYGDVLEDLEIITPEEKELKRITEIIMRILAGKKEEEDKDSLIKMIQKLKERGAEKVILGCTELPLLLETEKSILDTLQILAEATVRESVRGKELK